MAFWTVALRAIPWATILANAPGMMRTADRLLRTQAGSDSAASSDEFVGLANRVDELERRDRAHAELVERMTSQIESLTTATQVLAARVRLLLGLTVVLAVISLVLLALMLR